MQQISVNGRCCRPPSSRFAAAVRRAGRVQFGPAAGRSNTVTCICLRCYFRRVAGGGARCRYRRRGRRADANLRTHMHATVFILYVHVYKYVYLYTCPLLLVKHDLGYDQQLQRLHFIPLPVGPVTRCFWVVRPYVRTYKGLR